MVTLTQTIRSAKRPSEQSDSVPAPQTQVEENNNDKPACSPTELLELPCFASVHPRQPSHDIENLLRRSSIQVQYDEKSRRSPLSDDSDDELLGSTDANEQKNCSIFKEANSTIVGLSVIIFITRILGLALITRYINQFLSTEPQPKQDSEGYNQTSDGPEYSQLQQTHDRHVTYLILTNILVFINYCGSSLLSVCLYRCLHKFMKEGRTVHKVCSSFGYGFDTIVVATMCILLLVEQILQKTNNSHLWAMDLGYSVNVMCLLAATSWAAIFPLSLFFCPVNRKVYRKQDRRLYESRMNFMQVVSKMVRRGCTKRQLTPENSMKQKLKELESSPRSDFCSDLLPIGRTKSLPSRSPSGRYIRSARAANSCNLLLERACM